MSVEHRLGNQGFFFVPCNKSSTLMRVLEGFVLDFAVNGKLTSKCH